MTPPLKAHIALLGTALLAVTGIAATLLLLDGPAPAETTVVGLDGLAVGDCLLTPSASEQDPASFWGSEGEWPATMTTVSCDAPHDAEVLFIGDGWDADTEYPGEASLDQRYWARCDTEFVLYTGATVPQSLLDYTGWTPSEESWREGDRELSCLAFDPSGQPLEGSIR